jgi:hypothetical protein
MQYCMQDNRLIQPAPQGNSNVLWDAAKSIIGEV